MKREEQKKEIIRTYSEHRIHLNEEYKSLLDKIKTHLRNSQLRAAISVNRELIQFYWEVGSLILEKQEKAKWGDKLFDILSLDLGNSFPGTKGFSKTNLKNMRIFAAHYPKGEFSQALPDQLTWTHHVVLFQMVEAEKLHIK